ncbi:MAG: hypothetical protein QNJ03_05400, partial [Dinoroseobacter sp.]|nr:hypothetical protein [Dinoroseobacter sp.]
MKNWTNAVFVAGLLLSPQLAVAQDADTVFTNGRIYTVESDQPMVEAFALRDGRFLKVGSAEDMESVTGENTEVIDLEGQFVMPGFNDAHSHPLRSQLFIDVDLELP